MAEKILVFGAGGHAKSVISILESSQNWEIVGILVDPEFSVEKNVLGYPVLGGRELTPSLLSSGVNQIVVGIGDNLARATISEDLKRRGLKLVVSTHAKTTIASEVEIGMGSVIHAQVIVGPQAVIGYNNIISANVVIGHGSKIGKHVHLTPGVLLGGNVIIGDFSFLGLGSAVLPGIEIGKNVTIGANAVVISDVEDNAIFVGNPGKMIRSKLD